MPKTFKYRLYPNQEQKEKLEKDKLRLASVGKVKIKLHRELELQVRNMVKNRYLAKSITDAGWNLFLTILTYKVEETGKRVVEVEARNTSQTCSNCGKLRKEKLKLSQRKFSCFKCDYQENRDINAARNILKRAERSQWKQGLGTSLQGAVPMGAVKNWEIISELLEAPILKLVKS